MSDVSIIGTGMMGTALTRTLIQAGYSVTVWNRTPEKAAALSRLGASVVATLGAAVTASSTIILMVADYAAVQAILEDSGDRDLAGKAIINLVTGSDNAARQTASKVAVLGADYLDGAIEAYPNDIGKPTTLINYSGSERVWNEKSAFLKRLAGGSNFLGEDPGLANVADAAIAGAFFQTALAGFIEAAAFARANGMPISQIQSTADYMIDMLKGLVAEGCRDLDDENWETDQATLDVYLAAVRTWHAQMSQSGIKPTMTEANLLNLELASKAGLGGKSIFSQVLVRSADDIPR